MLSRQYRARLTCRSRTFAATSRLVFAPPKSITRSIALFPLKTHITATCRIGQLRNYAQEAVSSASDANSPLSPFTYHQLNSSDSSDPPAHLETLRVCLAASLLPLHQPLSIGPSAKQQLHTIRETEDVAPGHQAGHQASFSIPIDDGLGESVVGVVSPLEGGDCYNRQAVLETASRLGADVVSIDIALAIGLSETLGIKGTSRTAIALTLGAPRLPDKNNPLLADETHEGDLEDMDEDMDFPGDDRGGHVRIPVMTLGAMPTQAQSSPGINPEWVGLFHHMVNMNDSDRPRIILLESCTAMLSTFPIWWPSLAEALRTRRRQPRPTSGRKTAAKSAARDLIRPTSVVLSCAPSLLGTHTGTAHSQTNVAPQEDDGGNWWGSAECDVEGRRLRDHHRLETLRESDLE